MFVHQNLFAKMMKAKLKLGSWSLPLPSFFRSPERKSEILLSAGINKAALKYLKRRKEIHHATTQSSMCTRQIGTKGVRAVK